MDDKLFPKKDGKTLTSDIDYVDVWRVRTHPLSQFAFVFFDFFFFVFVYCHCVLLCLQGIEALQASGKVKSIGVSNFNILQLERLLALCRVPPAVNQVLHI